ncbi:MAG TPA: DUF4405 domain-containing protein [Chloroflexi bacterium]|nr:DUF4405 domain-containing protein [Chloroflexota bacterium]
MFNRAKLNFAVDALILVAFLASAISGLVLLTMPHGGYQGGRNPYFGESVLFLSRDNWNDVHVWGSLAVIGGIVVHLALHWKWIVCMVKKFLAPGERRASADGPQPVPVWVSDLDN